MFSLDDRLKLKLCLDVLDWFGSARKANILTGLNEIDSTIHDKCETKALTEYLLSATCHSHCVEQLARILTASDRCKLTEHHLKALFVKV